MKRMVFGGSAFVLGLTGTSADPPKVKAADVPMKLYGRTGAKVGIIAQGGQGVYAGPTMECRKKA